MALDGRLVETNTFAPRGPPLFHADLCGEDAVAPGYQQRQGGLCSAVSVCASSPHHSWVGNVGS